MRCSPAPSRGGSPSWTSSYRSPRDRRKTASLKRSDNSRRRYGRSGVPGGRRFNRREHDSMGGFVHHDVAALLAVQEDDVALHGLELRLAELTPRLETMAKERDRAVVALEQARQTVASEERRRQDVASRVAQHREIQA